MITTDITQIWDDFHTELRHYIRNKVRCDADADDILQEVFLKILRNKHKVDQAEHLERYLYGIVRNAVNDYFRSKKGGLPSGNLHFEIPAEDETLQDTINLCCLKPFIAQLPEKYSEALNLTELEGMPQKELAEKLGISYSGAKTRVQRGREKLKAAILDCCAVETDRYGNLLDLDTRNCKNNC